MLTLVSTISPRSCLASVNTNINEGLTAAESKGVSKTYTQFYHREKIIPFLISSAGNGRAMSWSRDIATDFELFNFSANTLGFTRCGEIDSLSPVANVITSRRCSSLLSNLLYAIVPVFTPITKYY